MYDYFWDSTVIYNKVINTIIMKLAGIVSKVCNEEPAALLSHRHTKEKAHKDLVSWERQLYQAITWQLYPPLPRHLLLFSYHFTVLVHLFNIVCLKLPVPLMSLITLNYFFLVFFTFFFLLLFLCAHLNFDMIVFHKILILLKSENTILIWINKRTISTI